MSNKKKIKNIYHLGINFINIVNRQIIVERFELYN